MLSRFLLPLLLALLPAAPALADDYADALKTFRNASQSKHYLDKAYGYALFPTIGKGGVGLGAAHGSGRVYVKGKHVGDTTMNQVSVGLQLGGQAFSQIIFFEDERAFREFTGGNFEFGAEASAVAITAAAGAQAGTGGATAGVSGGKNDAAGVSKYYKGFAIFTIAKGGLMYQAAVSGQKFSYKAVK